jgi:hypothetical protein
VPILRPQQDDLVSDGRGGGPFRKIQTPITVVTAQNLKWTPEEIKEVSDQSNDGWPGSQSDDTYLVQPSQDFY